MALFNVVIVILFLVYPSSARLLPVVGGLVTGFKYLFDNIDLKKTEICNLKLQSILCGAAGACAKHSNDHAV